MRAPCIPAANQHKHTGGPHEVHFTLPHPLTAGLTPFGHIYFKFQWCLPVHSPIMQLCHWKSISVICSHWQREQYLNTFNTFFLVFCPFPSVPVSSSSSSAMSLQKWPKHLSRLSLHGWLLLFHPVETEMIGPLFPILLPPCAFLRESRQWWWAGHEQWCAGHHYSHELTLSSSRYKPLKLSANL